MSTECTLSFAEVKNASEAFAITAGAVYFAVKLWTGYLTCNLTLGLQTYRHSADQDNDWLAIRIEITKGDRRSVLLHDVAACVEPEREPREVIRVAAPRILRGSYWSSTVGKDADEKKIDSNTLATESVSLPNPAPQEGRKRAKKPAEALRRRHVSWGHNVPSMPFVRLSPGDQTVHAILAKVPKGCPCMVTVAVMGGYDGPRKRVSQWRASTVSMPITAVRLESMPSN